MCDNVYYAEEEEEEEACDNTPADGEDNCGDSSVLENVQQRRGDASCTVAYVDGRFRQVLQACEDVRADLETLIANQSKCLRQWEYAGPFNSDLFRISNVGQPAEARDATTKSYVDRRVDEIQKQVEKIPKLRISKLGNLNVQKSRIVNLAMPTHKDDAASKRYVDETMLLQRDFINRNTLRRTGENGEDYHFQGKRLTNVADPVHEDDAVNLKTLRRLLLPGNN